MERKIENEDYAQNSDHWSFILMQDKNQPCRIVVAGCGHWGKNLVRNFAELGVLAGICDPDIELAQQYSEKYNIPLLSWKQILQDTSIEAVAIATPAGLHAQLAEEALNANKDIFVEKPLALELHAAEKICQLANDKNRILMLGHLMQYHPAFIQLKKIVHSGELGQLQYIYSNRLNFGKLRREENILWSFAPHDISMILSLTGQEPTHVNAVGSCFLHETIADVSTTFMIFPNNIRAQIFVSWLYPYKEQKLIVVGSNGMAIFDDTKPWEKKLALYPHRINWHDGIPLPSKADAHFELLNSAEPLTLECQHFIDCVNLRRQPLTDGKEGLNVLRVLKSASESLAIPVESAHSEQSYSNLFIHESSYIDENVKIGAGTKLWHFSHILPNCEIGKKCIIGQNVMIGPNVKIGNYCKIQNNVSIYKGVTLEDGVFCGPSCVFTNVNTPRAQINRKKEFLSTYVERGVTIGANATIVCGVRLGAYCSIGAGAVVTKDVKPHALMVGNPARQIGWVSHSGERLNDDLICPKEKRSYRVTSSNELKEIMV